MTEVVGIRFERAGKIYYFEPGELQVSYGDRVVVESSRGLDFGTVTTPVQDIEPDKIPQPLRPIIRIATEEDEKKYQENKEKEPAAFEFCQQQILAAKLPMKLIKASYTFDGSKIVFYFSSDNRVDFRELVKVLASHFHTRIELRQVGVRDEARLVGGYSTCGRELCCASFLDNFHPVSIKMAKKQNLALNPSKISGVCGRLMCCLCYEYDEDDGKERRRKDKSGCDKNCSTCTVKACGVGVGLAADEPGQDGALLEDGE
jgi:cell fate regulator YaaT (PSP1 superfamily)